MPAPRFLAARLPADGSFLLERSRTTGLRADLMQESRRGAGEREEVASLLVLRGIDVFERREVVRELAARYRRVEEVPATLPSSTASLHRLVVGQNVVQARGLGSLARIMGEFGVSWSRISAGTYELWAPLAEGSDGAAAAAQLREHYQQAGLDVQTRVAMPSAEDYEVFRLLRERCGPSEA